MKEATIFPVNLMFDIFCEEDTNLPVDLEGTILYVISRFDKRVQTVILGRYYDGKTYDQIGNELGISRERVRQMEARAIRQMRNPKCRNLLSIGIAEHISQIRINAAESTANKQIAAATEVIGLAADRLSKLTGDDELSAIREKALQNSHLALSISDLEISVRTFNCLNRAGLRTVGDILNCSDLSRVRNLGQKCLEEITLKIRDLGFEINSGNTI